MYRKNNNSMCKEMPMIELCSMSGAGFTCVCWMLSFLLLVAVTGVILKLGVARFIILFRSFAWRAAYRSVAFRAENDGYSGKIRHLFLSDKLYFKTLYRMCVTMLVPLISTGSSLRFDTPSKSRTPVPIVTGTICNHNSSMRPAIKY